MGLYSEDRLTQPQVKKDGKWIEVSWEQALDNAVEILAAAKQDGGQLSALVSPSSATEEHYLAQRLVRGLGSNRIEHRLREQDFSDDGRSAISRRFGMKIAELEKAQSVLLVGCNIRHEAPILGHRLRKAWQRGASIAVVNPLDWDFVFGVKQTLVVPPQRMVDELAGVAAAVAGLKGLEMPAALAELAKGTEVSAEHRAIAEQMTNAERAVVVVGQFAMAHHQAAALRQLAAWIAQATGSALNLLPHGANSTGAWLAGSVPHHEAGGKAIEDASAYSAFVKEPGQTWLLWDIEPDYDCDNPAQVMQALRAARSVVAACSFASDSLREVADVLLPCAPVAESEGSLINLDGDVFAFAAAGKPSGDSRPGWKILRQLGGQLMLEGFDQVSLAEVQAELHEQVHAGELPGQTESGYSIAGQAQNGSGLFRVGEMPMYSSDALCRRALPLQQTPHADSDFVGLNQADADRLGLMDGGRARVRQGDRHVETEVRVSGKVPAGAAWIRSGTSLARELGPAVGPVSVEVA
jgi:NADH-quinone oxidoreductase subunit G